MIMDWRKRIRNLLCVFLIMLLALPQYVNVSAEETPETEEVFFEEDTETEVQQELETADEEETSEELEFESEEESFEEESVQEKEVSEEQELLLSIDEDYAELHVGDSFVFEAIVSGSEEEIKVTWNSDAEDVVSIDEDGKVLALKEGIANITASVLDGSLTANAIVRVLPEEHSGIVFEQRSYEVNAGDTIKVPYEITGDDQKEIVWSVEGDDIVKVNTDETGELLIEAVSGGVAQINARIDGVNTRISVVVLQEDPDELSASQAPSNASTGVVTGTYSLTYNQSSARDLAIKLNLYRVDTAQIAALTYDFTLEKYAMQRVAEIVLSFEHIRPDGSSYQTVFNGEYGSASTTNLKENLLCTGDGSMSTSLQVLNRVLANNTQRTNSLRTQNRSFGIAHAVYNGIDYWVMLFSDTPARNKSQTSAIDRSKDVTVKIGSNLYDKNSLTFYASKTVLKVNVGKSVSLPSIGGSVSVVLGGKRKAIAFSGYSVSWTLDANGKKYASISNGKVVAGNKPNNTETAYVIATPKMNGVTQQGVKVQLKVIQPVTGVEVLPKSAGVDVGKTYQMTAIVSPENATDKTVIWKSSNTKIATVSTKGVVTAKKGGTCTITAVTNDGGFKASCNVTVIVHAKDISFEVGELMMSVDMADKLVPVFTPADTTDKRVTFSSSAPSKVKVDTDGTVTALAVTGDDPVIITMKTVDGGLTAELPVTVKEKDRAAKPSASFLYDSMYEIEAYDYDEAGFADTLIKGDQIKLHTVTKDAVIYYTLDGSTPSKNSTQYVGMIPYEGGDLTIKAIAVKEPQMRDSEVATFKFEQGEEPDWEILEEDLEKLKEQGRTIPAGLWAAGVDETAVYTGDKITFPNLRVYHRNHLLEIKQDYTLSYKNNVNVCPEGSAACEISYKDDGSYVPAKNTKVAYIMITGKGNYKGSTYIPFKIVPIEIKEENGFAYQSELYETLGSKPINPLPVITWNGKKLKNKTDYVIAYSKDVHGTQILDGGIKESDLPEGAKYADFYAIISGVKNFTYGTDRFAVPIHVKKDAKLLSKVVIKVQNIEYPDHDITADDLTITVTSGKTVLEKGKDYVIEKISPEPIRQIGTYNITIKATDESEFVGEKTGTFKITGKALSKAKIYCLGKTVTYTGTTFTIHDLYKSDAKRPDLSDVTLFYGDERLVEGKDFTVEVSGQNKGKGSIKFIGIGNYTGTVKRDFTINPLPVSKEDILIYTTDVSFTKTGARPEVYVFLKADPDPDDPSIYEISDGIYGKYLFEKEDYTLKFFNNKKIYTDSEFKTKNAPSVSVIMKGNYKGTFANNNFLILSEDISYMRIEAADIVYSASKKGTQYYVKPVIYDYEGKKLALNKDYQLTYYYAQDAKVNGSSTYNRAYGTAVRASDIPEPGTIIGVRADGIGSYYGTLKTEYKVYKKAMNLSSATVKVLYNNGKNQYFEYTGAQIVPAAENLKVTLSKKELTYGVDYEILSLNNNVKAGKATMVLRGLGEYGGTKKVAFSIGKQSLVLDIGNLLRKLFGMD